MSLTNIIHIIAYDVCTNRWICMVIPMLDVNSSKYIRRSQRRHDMEPRSALLALCERNTLLIGGFLSQRLVMQSACVFFVVNLNKLLNKQSICQWFEKPYMWRYASQFLRQRNIACKLGYCHVLRCPSPCPGVNRVAVGLLLTIRIF